MSQQDFDKLGSTIVQLGNNLATTEAEIVAMGMRLAGAGSQIGLTEAQTMSFAGALSSVGVEAEAGGSAFSRLMVDMQLAAETGGGNLKKFAQVAGMSSQEFQKAFKEDAAGAIISFIQGLGSAEEKGISAIKVLDDMGITEIRLRDALLRAAGASDVFSGALNMGTEAWKENTALTKEAEQRYNTTASQIEIAKNHLKDAGITIGEVVVPYFIALTEKIKSVSEWFSKLNPETQKTIIMLAGLLAAVGPVILVFGSFAGAISNIIGVGGKLITHWGTISGAASKLSVFLKPLLGGLFTPWGIAIAAAVAVGLLVIKNWDKIKESAGNLKQWIGDKFNGIKTSVTETWQNLKDNAYNWAANMMDMFKKGITDRVNVVVDAAENVGNRIKNFLGFSSPTKEGPLSDSDKWMPSFMQMLADGINQNSDKVNNATEDLAQRIGDSLSKVNNYAVNTVGVIEKKFQLWALQNGVVRDSAEYLSGQLEVQKQKHEILNAQIEVTKEALAGIIAKYGEGSEQALEYQNKILDLKIAQAELGETIKTTTDTIAKQTDELTKWIEKVASLGKDSERVAKGLSSKDKNKVYESALVVAMTQEWKKTGTIKVGKNARGTNFWPGGLTWVGEQGPELIDLPRGSKVFSNEKSTEMAKGDIHQHITINSPTPLTPSEIARKNLQVSRQLAMEWGF